MEADLRPHRSRYWLNAKAQHEDPATFAAQVETICSVYAYAPLLEALGCHVVSTDEMTGIQALERAAPTKPLPRQVSGDELALQDHQLGAGLELDHQHQGHGVQHQQLGNW